MARIKITDLPKDMKITKAEMRRVRGGFNVFKPVPARYGGDKWSFMPFVERMKAAKMEMMPTAR